MNGIYRMLLNYQLTLHNIEIYLLHIYTAVITVHTLQRVGSCQSIQYRRRLFCAWVRRLLPLPAISREGLARVFLHLRM